MKPELTGPGVSVLTTEPGVMADGSPRLGTLNGSSAAAAAVAGAAAVLAEARPGLDASGLKSALVGSAQPLDGVPVVAQGAGLVDVAAAAAAEVAVTPAALSFGRASGPRRGSARGRSSSRTSRRAGSACGWRSSAATSPRRRRPSSRPAGSVSARAARPRSV